MTISELFPLPGVAYNTTLERELRLASQQVAETSAILREASEHRWWDATARDLLHVLLERQPDQEAWRDAVRWLLMLQPGTPRPSVGGGDDGTISIEWDRAGNVLHVMFSGDQTEVYFASENGDEFETVLPAGEDKLWDALAEITRSYERR